MLLIVGIVFCCFVSSAAIGAFFYFNESARKWFNKNILGKDEETGTGDVPGDSPGDVPGDVPGDGGGGTGGQTGGLTPEEQAALDAQKLAAEKLAAEEEKKRSKECPAGEFAFCPLPGYTYVKVGNDYKCCEGSQTTKCVNPVAINTTSDIRKTKIYPFLDQLDKKYKIKDATYGKPKCGGSCALLVNVRADPQKVDSWGAQMAFDPNNPKVDSPTRVCKPTCPKSGSKLGVADEQATVCFLNNGTIDANGNNTWSLNAGKQLKWTKLSSMNHPTVTDYTRDTAGSHRLRIADCYCDGKKFSDHALVPKNPAAWNDTKFTGWKCVKFTSDGVFDKECTNVTKIKDRK